MAKISNSKGKRWPPNVGENMGRVRFRKKIPVDVELTFGIDSNNLFSRCWNLSL